MANHDEEPKEIPDVPELIFEKFLSELKTVDVSNDIAERLKRVILGGSKPTEQAIKTALFSDTQNL